MSSRLGRCALALSLTGLVVVGVQVPSVAQDRGQGSDRCTTQGGGSGPGNAPGNSPQYPPAQGEGVSDSNPNRGQQMSATSGCRKFAPGQRVAFGVESTYQQLGTGIASVGGEAQATFTVPTNLANGRHHVVFRGTGFTGAPNEVRIPFTVVGGAVAVPGGGTVSVGGVGLPRTGSDEVVPLTALGLGLVVAGAGIALVARRRRLAGADLAA